MYRALPVGNKLCARKEEDRKDALLKARLREVRSSLDTRPPRVMNLDHLRVNLKREQQLEERYMEIDKQNRILLQKMSTILKPSANSSSTSSRITSSSQPVHLPSLNREARKRELMRITQENQHILNRIQRAQPMYDHVLWEQNHREQQKHLKNCCEYPIVLPIDQNRKPAHVSKLSNSINTTSPRLADNPPVEASNFVHKEGKRIGSTHYLLEMTTDGRALTVSAYDTSSQRTLELVINERNHRKLFRECGGDYAALAKKVMIEGDKLVISKILSQLGYH